MRLRTTEGSENTKSLMRYCTIEDFESRGIKVDADYAKIIVLRMCPDIPDDQPMF
jgi:hypothetical protein